MPRTCPSRRRLAIRGVTHLPLWLAHERRAVHTNGSAATATPMRLARRGNDRSPFQTLEGARITFDHLGESSFRPTAMVGMPESRPELIRLSAARQAG